MDHRRETSGIMSDRRKGTCRSILRSGSFFGLKPHHFWFGIACEILNKNLVALNSTGIGVVWLLVPCGDSVGSTTDVFERGSVMI